MCANCGVMFCVLYMRGYVRDFGVKREWCVQIVG